MCFAEAPAPACALGPLCSLVLVRASGCARLYVGERIHRAAQLSSHSPQDRDEHVSRRRGGALLGTLSRCASLPTLPLARLGGLSGGAPFPRVAVSTWLSERVSVWSVVCWPEACGVWLMVGLQRAGCVVWTCVAQRSLSPALSAFLVGAAEGAAGGGVLLRHLTPIPLNAAKRWI